MTFPAINLHLQGIFHGELLVITGMSQKIEAPEAWLTFCSAAIPLHHFSA